MNIKKVLIRIFCLLVVVAIIVYGKKLLDISNYHKNIDNLMIDGIKIVLRVIRN